MKIFIDLDGTLIDSSDRLYKLFCLLTGSDALSKKKYWLMKRSRISHEVILNSQYKYSPDDISVFQNRWHGLIESREFIDLDVPHSDIDVTLKRLSAMHDLHLVTARQDGKMVEYQLQKFGWLNYFSSVLVTERKFEKCELIQKLEPKKTDWVIGDTGHDGMAAKKLNLKSAVVLNGFLDKNSLLTYMPDLILESFSNFKIRTQ